MLLHGSGDSSSSLLFKIAPWSNKDANQFGLIIYSKKQLIDKKYPSAPTQDFYLALKIEKIKLGNLEGVSYNFKNLRNYATFRGSSIPFPTTLSELLNHKSI